MYYLKRIKAFFAFIVCYLFMATSSYGSSAITDKMIARQVDSDSLAVKWMSKANQFYPEKLDSSLFYAEQVMEMVRRENSSSSLEEETLNLLGRIHNQKGLLKQAETFYQESAKISRTKNNHSEEAKNYQNLGQLYRKQGDFEQALSYYTSSLQIRERKGDIAGQASIHNSLGNLYRAWGQRETAFESYRLSIELNEKAGDQSALANAYLNLGSWMARDSKFDEARGYYEKYRKIQEELKDTLALVIVMMNLGNLDLDQGSYGQALEQYLEALRILERKDVENFSYANLHNNIGKVYELQREFDRAKPYYRKASSVYNRLGYQQQYAETLTGLGAVFLKEGNRDSAIAIYNQALTLYADDSSNGLALLYQRIGQVYYSDRNYRQALQEYQKAAAVFEENGADRNLAHLYNSIGATLYFLEKYDNAMEYYRQSLTLSNQVSDLQQKENALFNIYEVLELQGQYQEALDYHKQYLAVRTQRINEQKNRDILELTAKYETEKKDAEISLLQVEQERSEALIEKQNAERKSLFIGVIALIVVIIAIAWWLLYKIRKEKIIAGQKEHIYRQEIDSLMEKQQLESVQAMLEGQDKERKRLAAELHDRLGSLLSLVKIYFSSMDNSIRDTKPELYKSFQDGKEILDDTFREVREIIKEMNDGKVSGKGLGEDIQKLLNKIDKFGIAIKSQVELKKNYTDSVELNLYRIIQEALSNALKYSRADRITLSLLETDHHLELKVQDNGVGFDTAEVNTPSEHYGLENIENRAKMLGGTFSLYTGKDRGVRIEIRIPLEQSEPKILITKEVHD